MELQKQKMLVPNIFQYEALQKLEETNKNKGVVVMPTGTGKTFLASLWFKKQLETNSKAKLLFICHNKDILSQANEKEFQNCLKDLDITYGYYNARRKDIQQCTFATTQTLTRNLNEFSQDYFDYIIVDEAHHYQAKSFKKVLEYFKPSFLLGLTATPNRMDGKNIYKICGNKLYEAKINDAIKKGLLTKIKYYCVDNDIDFSDVKWNGNNYDEKDLNRRICVKEYDEAIIKEYNKTVKVKFNKTKTICFCATVEHAHRMSKLFNENNISAIALTGKRHSKKARVTIHRGKREHIIEDFKKGVYEIIFVRDLFNEGVDIPDADCVMMLRPTQSHTIFTQQIGRGLRTSKNKEDVLILDFTGNARKCIINFEVLSDMIDLDIIKKVKAKEYGRKNNIVILSNGCEVRLNKFKLDLIKYSSEGRNRYSKEGLIKIYFDVKNKLGHAPSAIELGKVGHVSWETYRTYFGGWDKFKNLYDDQKKHSKKRVIKQFKNYKKQFGNFPSIKDIRKINKIKKGTLVSDNTIRNLFGSYARFIKEVGGKVRKYTRLDLSKEKTIKDYYRIKKELGRVPFSYELNKHLPYSFTSAIVHFYGKGEYGNFLKIINKEDYKLWRKQISNVNRSGGDGRKEKTCKYSKKGIEKEYIHIYNKIGRHLNQHEIHYREYKKLPSTIIFQRHLQLKNQSIKTIHSYFDKILKEKQNIKITPNYKPKTIIIPIKKNKKGLKKSYEGWHKEEYKSKVDKVDIREKIISNIKDGDTILLLESPDLSAIKEIERQDKKPKTIIIPNHLEFNKLVDAIQSYKTDLNIEIVNTSVLQYLVDSEEKFDFIWLDYCGAFSYYMKDLDILFQKHLNNMKLILTYNLFDPAKEDENYYFTRVIDYVLGKNEDKKVRLINDISYRYKKNMYNLGFNISKLEVQA